MKKVIVNIFLGIMMFGFGSCLFKTFEIDHPYDISENIIKTFMPFKGNDTLVYKDDSGSILKFFGSVIDSYYELGRVSDGDPYTNYYTEQQTQHKRISFMSEDSSILISYHLYHVLRPEEKDFFAELKINFFKENDSFIFELSSYYDYESPGGERINYIYKNDTIIAYDHGKLIFAEEKPVLFFQETNGTGWSLVE